MIKTINIGNSQSFEINSSNGWLYIYQEQFGHDVLPVLLPAAEALIQMASKLMAEADTDDVADILKNADSETISDAFITLSGMQLTTLTNIVWAMAKNADYNIEAPREWYNSYDNMPWDIVMPQALKAALQASVSKKKYDTMRQRLGKLSLSESKKSQSPQSTED